MLVFVTTDVQQHKPLCSSDTCADVTAELDDIVDAARAAHNTSINPWRALFSKRFAPQLIILVALQMFNQLDGINSIMFYAPQLFDALGSGQSAALQTHVIIGVVNVVTTFVAVFTVDSLGRTFWMIEASAHMAVSAALNHGATGGCLMCPALPPASITFV